MRLVINIFKWIIVSIGAILIVLFTLSFLLRNRVVDIVLASLNKNISTKVEIGGYRLSLIRKFPRAAIELKNVSVFSSKNFDRSQFGKINTDTLLTAGSAFLEFGITDIIKGNYNIGSIAISQGRLNLLSDSSGGINYDITYKSTGKQGDDLVINLEKINVSGLEVRYVNRATSLDISGSVETGTFKSRIAGNDIDLICNSSFVIRNFELFSESVKANAAVTIDLNLHESDSGTVFRKGNIRLEDFRFGLTGSISSADIMDLKISGQNIQLARIKKYLPEKYSEKFSEYSPEGLLKTECRITGLASRKQNPGISLTWSLEKGKVLYRKSNIRVSDLSFSGSFSNGQMRRPESFRILVDNYHFRIGSALWSGSFSLTDFNRPEINMLFSGEVIPSELMEFMPLPGIREADGSMRINLSLSGMLEKKEKYDLADLLDLNPQADINFNSLSVKEKNGRFSIDDIDGNIMLAKNLWAEELYFSYLGQRFRVNGEFRNLPGWLAGKKVGITAIADISADNLNPDLFLSDSTAAQTGKSPALHLPDSMEADVSFRVNNLTWDSFHAENVSGTLQYSPGRIDFRSLTINALNGNIAGDCFLIQNRSKSFVARGSFTFDNLDINKAFKSFKNFGQDFIVADNLSGSLSGSLSIMMPLDSLLNPVGAGVTAEGKYVLVNGALINFEPVKELSGFIEVSELENITFSRLENDLFIRDKYVAVPQMDIKSSAADFTISGKHYFDDSYEYHVKTYLSEILSKKARKGSRYSNEFGAIEEDGLGRTSIFLKVSGKDEDIKVVYDLKAAGYNVKQNLKKEKGNLKSILNEEYGWFKRDSTVKRDNSPKPKFRITFPETDSAAAVKDTIPVDKDRRINRIFKKKFNQYPVN
jgi:AsmA-like C-terminal region